MKFVANLKADSVLLKRVLLSLLALFISTAISLKSLNSSFALVGWPLYDFWQRLTAKPAPKDVVVVLITQHSLDELRENPELKLGWPWPREIYGPFLELASELRAKSVAFDLLFDSPSVYGQADDQIFNRSIEKFLNKNPAARIVFPAPTNQAFKKPNTTVIGNLDARLNFGAVNLPLDDDGVFRRVFASFWGTDSKYYPALGEASVLGPPKKDVMSGVGENKLKVSDRLLRFYKAESIEVIDFVDVILLYRIMDQGNKPAGELEKKAAKLLEKHWILGVAAAGLFDLKPIPTDERTPGVYLHATHALNLLHNDQVFELPSAALFAIAICLGAAISFIVFWPTSPRPALIGSLIVVLVGLPFLSLLFWISGRWFNPLPGVVAFSAFAAVCLSYRFQTEWRERERFIRSLKNSMSDSMVQLIRSGKIELSRFGERREISILFSDLSGFTELAESTEADKLVEILNLYLDECVDLIFRHNGYVDKFIGDAIMALWGAPVISVENHALMAFRTAVSYKNAVASFNKKVRERYGVDRDLFNARVGLHFGPAICGNIGSHSRYNYTAVGDSVNLASRLEGLGKQYNLFLFISEDAVMAAGMTESSEIYLVDQVAVKGRSAPVKIYSSTSDIPVEQIQLYRTGFAYYEKGEWELAARAFGQSHKVPPARIMEERCQMALKHGELKQLKSGVWHHDEK
jgi:adenylate cyclase